VHKATFWKSAAVVTLSLSAGGIFGWWSAVPSIDSATTLSFAVQLSTQGIFSSVRLHFLKYVLCNNFATLATLYSYGVVSGGLSAVFFCFTQGVRVGAIMHNTQSNAHGAMIGAILMIPHGIPELASFIIASSSVLCLWHELLRMAVSEAPGPNAKAISTGLLRVNSLAAIFLFAAALVEAYVTPALGTWIAHVRGLYNG